MRRSREVSVQNFGGLWKTEDGYWSGLTLRDTLLCYSLPVEVSMPLYLISYDLLNKATFGEYETLIAEIKRLGGQKALYSQWAIRRNETAMTLLTHLRQYVHATDRFLVCEITTNWASVNLLCDLNKI